MSVSSIVDKRFVDRYGFDIKTAADNLEKLQKFILPGNHSFSSEEIVGRGYVHFGKGISAKKSDKESRKILRSW